MILLILAGITLVYVFGDNGIVKLAKDAKNETEAGIQKEQDDLGILANMLKEEYGNSTGSGNGEGSGGNTINPPDNPNPPVKEPTIVGTIDKIQDTTTTVEDTNGNPVVVPGGFKVVVDTADNDIDYTYSGDGTPAVQDGIVIEDEDGNQFVWIPVGDIKNKDGTTTTITLGRYRFDTTNGEPTLIQDANDYANAVAIDQHKELVSSSKCTPAKDLGDFVTKTMESGGYFLGRYEASSGSGGVLYCRSNMRPSVSITQESAALAARNMYNSSSFVESDLINSYSWDTAIVFIQSYSDNSNYANQVPLNPGSVVNTGASGDKVCNIHDMATNCGEWTTEESNVTYNSTDGSRLYYYLTSRGGELNRWGCEPEWTAMSLKEPITR